MSALWASAAGAERTTDGNGEVATVESRRLTRGAGPAGADGPDPVHHRADRDLRRRHGRPADAEHDLAEPGVRVEGAESTGGPAGLCRGRAADPARPGAAARADRPKASALGMRANPYPAFLIVPAGKVIGEPHRIKGNEMKGLIVKTPARAGRGEGGREAKARAKAVAAAAAKKAKRRPPSRRRRTRPRQKGRSSAPPRTPRPSRRRPTPRRSRRRPRLRRRRPGRVGVTDGRAATTPGGGPPAAHRRRRPTRRSRRARPAAAAVSPARAGRRPRAATAGTTRPVAALRNGGAAATRVEAAEPTEGRRVPLADPARRLHVVLICSRWGCRCAPGRLLQLQGFDSSAYAADVGRGTDPEAAAAAVPGRASPIATARCWPRPSRPWR